MKLLNYSCYITITVDCPSPSMIKGSQRSFVPVLNGHLLLWSLEVTVTSYIVMTLINISLGLMIWNVVLSLSTLNFKRRAKLTTTCALRYMSVIALVHWPQIYLVNNLCLHETGKFRFRRTFVTFSSKKSKTTSFCPRFWRFGIWSFKFGSALGGPLSLAAIDLDRGFIEEFELLVKWTTDFWNQFVHCYEGSKLLNGVKQAQIGVGSRFCLGALEALISWTLRNAFPGFWIRFYQKRKWTSKMNFFCTLKILFSKKLNHSFILKIIITRMHSNWMRTDRCSGRH